MAKTIHSVRSQTSNS